MMYPEVRKGSKRRAVFLDRDGTIAYDVPYCSSPEEFQLVEGVGEVLSLFSHYGFMLVVVTNQSGVGRGYFNEGDLAKIHDKMCWDLDQQGVSLDGIFYCPHHPDEGCACRKPNPGLLLKASCDLDIDLPRSFMIGDQISDIQAAKAAGCRAVLVGDNPAYGSDANVTIDYSAIDIRQAGNWIIGEVTRVSEG